MLIHIGYSKCGSTSLQNIFKNTKSITYFDKPKIFSQKGKHLYRLTKWVKKIKNKSIKKNIVVSHEHMLLSRIDPKFNISIGGQKEARDLVYFLDSHFHQYNILLIIRDQFELIQSRYSQYIMQGGKVTLEKFINILIPKNDPFKFLDYRYDKILNILNKSNAKNIICLTTKEIDSPLFNSLIKKKTNLNLAKIKFRKNIKVSNISLNIIRLINIIFVKKKEDLETKTLTRCPYFFWLSLITIVKKIDTLLKAISLNKNFLNKSTVERIKKIYLKNNKKLKKKYGLII